jgi:hypothetical protein
LAGLWQLFVRLPKLFSGANRMRFHFLSYKFGRLVLPWTILLILAATFALPDTSWRSFLLLDEGMLAALALIDQFIPPHIFVKRISSPARTFVAMNLASLLAVIIFFVPPESLWRPTRMQVRQ